MALGYRQRAFQGYRSVTHGGALFRVDPERAGPNSRIDHPEYFAPPAPLYAQKRLYLWVAEHPDVYKLFPPGIARRVRAIELLASIAHDGVDTCVEWLDEWIAELREVLLTAATEVSETVARKLKRAA
jgi:hypothetical protein